jgi:hypothetical protein
MRADAGKVFRRSLVEEMGRALPSFVRQRSELAGAVLFTAPGGTAPWSHVLFVPDRWTDMFTIELARSVSREYPAGKLSFDLESWRSGVDTCLRVNRLEGTNRDTWWSPFPMCYSEQMMSVANEVYPSVEEAVQGMPRAVAAAVDYVRSHAAPLL